MKLGFLTACLPSGPWRRHLRVGPAEGFEALEIAAWPDLGDRPFTATHLNADGFGDREADEVRALFDRHGLECSSLAYYDNNLDPIPTSARDHEHVHRCIDAAARSGARPSAPSSSATGPGRWLRQPPRGRRCSPLVDTRARPA